MDFHRFLFTERLTAIEHIHRPHFDTAAHEARYGRQLKNFRGHTGRRIDVKGSGQWLVFRPCVQRCEHMSSTCHCFGQLYVNLLWLYTFDLVIGPNVAIRSALMFDNHQLSF